MSIRREFVIPTVGTTRAIERALAALADPLGAGSPGRLVFPPGGYTLDAPIEVRTDGVWLVGAEAGLSLVDGDAGPAVVRFVASPGAGCPA